MAEPRFPAIVLYPESHEGDPMKMLRQARDAMRHANVPAMEIAQFTSEFLSASAGEETRVLARWVRAARPVKPWNYR